MCALIYQYIILESNIYLHIFYWNILIHEKCHTVKSKHALLVKHLKLPHWDTCAWPFNAEDWHPKFNMSLYLEGCCQIYIKSMILLHHWDLITISKSFSICCAVSTWSPAMTSSISMRARTPTDPWSSVCRATRFLSASKAVETAFFWPSAVMPPWGCLVLLSNIKASFTLQVYGLFPWGQQGWENKWSTTTGSVFTFRLYLRGECHENMSRSHVKTKQNKT